MSIWSFWADPVGWFVNNYTWFLTAPWWYVVLNLAFWPIVFLKPWLLDRRDLRRNRKRALAARPPA